MGTRAPKHPRNRCLCLGVLEIPEFCVKKWEPCIRLLNPNQLTISKLNHLAGYRETDGNLGAQRP